MILTMFLLIKVDHSTGNEAVVKLANDFQFSPGPRLSLCRRKSWAFRSHGFKPGYQETTGIGNHFGG